MGNTTTFINPLINYGLINKSIPLQQQIELVGASSHPTLGLIHIWTITSLRNRENNKIFSKIQYGEDQSEKDTMLKVHNNLKEENHQNLLLYYGCTFYEQYNFTCNVIECHFFFELPSLTLLQVNDFNKKNLSVIKEYKIIALLDDLASVLNYLHVQNLFHGNLQPQTIFIDSQTQKAKITYYASINTKQQAKTPQIKEKVFYSPQQLTGMRIQMNGISDRARSDIFALGMTFLEIMAQKSSFDCYDFQLYLIKPQSIEQSLSLCVQNGYSERLIQIIRSMLAMEESIRINAQTLQNEIKALKQQQPPQQLSPLSIKYIQPDQNIQTVLPVVPSVQAQKIRPTYKYQTQEPQLKRNTIQISRQQPFVAHNMSLQQPIRNFSPLRFPNPPNQMIQLIQPTIQQGKRPFSPAQNYILSQQIHSVKRVSLQQNGFGANSVSHQVQNSPSTYMTEQQPQHYTPQPMLNRVMQTQSEPRRRIEQEDEDRKNRVKTLLQDFERLRAEL